MSNKLKKIVINTDLHKTSHKCNLCDNEAKYIYIKSNLFFCEECAKNFKTSEGKKIKSFEFDDYFIGV